MSLDDRSETPKGLILLAEAHPANRRLTVAQLEKLGYRVEAVATGVDVLKSLEKDPQRFDWVFLNCWMPELDGFETAKAIRWLERQWGTRIPIIAVSTGHEDQDACIAAGVDDILTTPVTLQSLRQVFADWKSSEPVREADQRPGSTGGERKPVLDAAIIDSLRQLSEEGGSDFLTQVIDVFLRDSAGWMEKIRTAARSGDTVAIREAVHTMKGSSGSLGASRLAGVCAQFELQLDRDELTDVGGWVRQVEDAYTQTCQALIAERQEDDFSSIS